jgi:membrane associated rhomboid family serine protease
MGGLTLITSFFLHAGVAHVLSNVYFLLVFGDNVEDFLGRFNVVLLLLVPTLAGELVHGLFAPESDAPLIGASAGISGIIVFYSTKFPDRRLRFFRLFRWFSMPASAALGFWAFSQILAARDQLSGSSDVSALAHIGGALVGLWFWFLWRNKDPVFGERSMR